MKIMLSFACLTLVATLLASPTLAQEPSWKGSGLPDDPYLIESVEHLLELQDAVSNFPSDNSQFPYNPVFKPFNGTHFLLTTDLDLADYNAAHPEGWTPIGYHYRENWGIINKGFYGHFDGGGHVIKNLYINTDTLPDYYYDLGYEKGLFTRLCGATVSNLGLVDVDVVGIMGVGALAGWAVASDLVLPNWDVIPDTPTSISNCYVTGKITGRSLTGGLVGYLRQSTVSNCFANAEVYEILEQPPLRYATQGHKGILVGQVYSESTVENSYATGSIHALDNATGGLAGGISNGGNIYNCYADVSLSTSFAPVPSGWHVASGGGIIGCNNSEYGQISNSIVLGDFTSQEEFTHPVVGLVNTIAPQSNTLRNNYVSSRVLINGEPSLSTDKNTASGETVDHQLLFSADFYSNPANWSPSDAGNNPIPANWSLSPQEDPRAIWNIWDSKSLPYFQYQSAPPIISSISPYALSGEYRTDDYARLEYISVSVNGQPIDNAQFDGDGNWTFSFPTSCTAGDKVSVTVKERGKAISYSLRASIPAKDLKDPPMAIQSPLTPASTDGYTSKLYTLTGTPVRTSNPPSGVYLRRLSHPSLPTLTQKIVLQGQ